MRIDRFVAKLSDKGFAKDNAGRLFQIVKDRRHGNRSWRYEIKDKSGDIVSGSFPNRDLAVVNSLSHTGY